MYLQTFFQAKVQMVLAPLHTWRFKAEIAVNIEKIDNFSKKENNIEH